MKCEGTKDEWIEFLHETEKQFFKDGAMDNIKSNLTVIESRGWITKPEWLCAFEKAKGVCDLRLVPPSIHEALMIMHDRIVELEKQVKGE
jgi:hypothetical protein